MLRKLGLDPNLLELEKVLVEAYIMATSQDEAEVSTGRYSMFRDRNLYEEVWGSHGRTRGAVVTLVSKPRLYEKAKELTSLRTSTHSGV